MNLSENKQLKLGWFLFYENLLIEQIDLLASLLAGVAKNTERIMAKQVATSSLAAQARAGESPLESTAVIDAPLVSSISTTSIMPNGAAKCNGLKKFKLIKGTNLQK